MKNQELVRIFYDIADILEIKNVEWKPLAYRKAARAIEVLGEDVEEIYKKDGIKGLKEIPGVGERIAEKIEEFIKTNKIKEYEKLKKTIPRHLTELMEIPGLGAKKAKKLYERLHIKSIKELEKAAKQHKISGLETFKEKSEENILKGIELIKKGKGRILLGVALPMARNIIEELKTLKDVKDISVAGSLRRMEETIGDIDILAISSNPKKVMDKFTSLKEVSRILAMGETKSMVILENGMQADIRVLDKKSYGAALQYFTGNKGHNIRLRELAIKKGYKLNEYGLFKKDKYICGRTEGEIYKNLGLDYIEPELRNNTNELELAKNRKLPKLVKLGEIKGDLHVHTKDSDGDNTIEEMCREAINLGYEYICISDHSKTRAIANGMKEEELLKQIREIDRLNKRFKRFRIFKGCEVDILNDGNLDFSDDILKRLDIVGAAVHSGFKMSESKMTERIIKALKDKYVKILYHPTGRLINQREPYQVDLNSLFDVAKEKKKFLEINGMINRLDLDDYNIKKAVEKGVRLVLGTDSHSKEHLRFMEYGVSQARRGWCEKKDIVNALSLKELVRLFNIK